MSAEDLVFELPPEGAADLVFGEFGAALLGTTIAAALPGPGLAVGLAKTAVAAFAAPLAGPGLSVVAQYQSNTQRPLVGTTRAAWSEADAAEAGAASAFRRATPVQAPTGSEYRQAVSVAAGRTVGFGNAVRLKASTESKYRQASALRASSRSDWQEMTRGQRPATSGRWENADSLRASRLTSWQERYRDRRPSAQPVWENARPLRRAQAARAISADPLRAGRGAAWREAMRPPPGAWVKPGPLPPDPCYVPDGHLLFDEAWTGGRPDLLLYCELHDSPLPTATVVVSVRTVYMTINNVTLTRVSNSHAFPVLGMRLSIDTDAWTWSFSASLPGAELEHVDPGTGDPIELEASINGNAYRVIVERISRERQFGQSRIAISGRGKNAKLAAPYAPLQTFSNASGDLTAAQLLDDALKVNGVSIGWDVDWGMDDWLVPADSWLHQGTHMTAALAIAQAAGGYVQPHRTANTLRVLHRYPTAPWDWAAATPDFELPADVTVREAIEWVDKPLYNRVFVSGNRNGVLAQVTRQGTAGDVVAPMLVDDLITAATPGRLRGLVALADTGRQAAVSLRLPVLNETGVIEPGKLVRYLDGLVPRVGLVRSTAVEVTAQTVRQVLGIETHVA